MTCLAILASCSYERPESYYSLEAGREKDSIDYLYITSMTYGTVLHVRSGDTLNLYSEPRGYDKLAVVLTDAEKITITDFVRYEFPASPEASDKNPTMKIYAKVKSDKGEGWQNAVTVRRKTDPDNISRFISFSSSEGVWIILLALISWIPYKIRNWLRDRKAYKAGNKPEQDLWWGLMLCVLTAFLGGLYAFMAWNHQLDIFTRHLWSWSMHPLMAKAYLVMLILVLAAFVMMIVEAWKRYRSPLPFLWNVLGITSAALLIFAASVIFSVVVFLVFLLAIGGMAVGGVMSSGLSGGSKSGGGTAQLTCPRCGQLFSGQSGYSSCPSCGNR